MQNVLFICRGSVQVGLGHIMRCRAVAEEMIPQAAVHIAVIGDAAIAATLLGPGLAHSTVTADAEIMDIYKSMQPDIVVFDLLDLDANIFQAIRRQSTTVCICPIFPFLDEVDLVFSRAASPIHERLARQEGGSIVRTGCRYATIGRHCRQVPTDTYATNAAQDPLAVAISMGGADAPNKTLQVLESIKNVPTDLLIWVLLGEGYTHSYQQLVECIPPLTKGGLGGVGFSTKGRPSRVRRHEIILARTIDSMWRIMGGCSVAILTGGITAYEAAYAGIPSIITLNDGTQRYLIQELVQSGAALYAGAPLTESLPAINDALVYLDANRDVLQMMHNRGRSLLDDEGARRIAVEILAFDSARQSSCYASAQE